ncbi:MAG: hypothetical protein KGZ42_13570 [Melioribacter sp.]|nr:hypothetical protein [Melioribacter sp.]
MLLFLPYFPTDFLNLIIKHLPDPALDYAHALNLELAHALNLNHHYLFYLLKIKGLHSIFLQH